MKNLSFFFSGGYKLQLIDQILAAAVTYFILVPFLIKGDFEGIARISIALTLYTFYLGAVRILIVNNILDQRLSHITTKEHLWKALFLSISAFACVPLHHFLKLSLIEALITAITIVISMQQEVMRQVFLSKKFFVNAIFLDSFWISTSSLLILYFSANQMLDVKNALLSWGFGALASALSATRLIQHNDSEVNPSEIISPLGKTILIIPILTTMHTLMFNFFMFTDIGVSDLGLFRSVQFIFLPAIFLINVQQNFFVPVMSGEDRSEIKNLQERFFSLQGTILVTSALLSLLYIEFTRVSYSNLYLILVVAMSVFLNSRIGNLSLHLIVSRKLNGLILSRGVWLVICCSLMYLLKNNIAYLLIILCLVDYIFLVLMKKIALSSL